MTKRKMITSARVGNDDLTVVCAPLSLHDLRSKVIEVIRYYNTALYSDSAHTSMSHAFLQPASHPILSVHSFIRPSRVLAVMSCSSLRPHSSSVAFSCSNSLRLTPYYSSNAAWPMHPDIAICANLQLNECNTFAFVFSRQNAITSILSATCSKHVGDTF